MTDRWSLERLSDEYPNLTPSPSWGLLSDAHGDPAPQLPPPINVRVDWLRVIVLAVCAAVLLLAGRWAGEK